MDGLYIQSWLKTVNHWSRKVERLKPKTDQYDATHMIFIKNSKKSPIPPSKLQDTLFSTTVKSGSTYADADVVYKRK